MYCGSTNGVRTAVLNSPLLFVVERSLLAGQCGRQSQALAHSVELGLDEERLCHGCRELICALLEFRNLLRVLSRNVGLLRRVLRDVVELYGGGQRRAPDQLPIA